MPAKSPVIPCGARAKEHAQQKLWLTVQKSGLRSVLCAEKYAPKQSGFNATEDGSSHYHFLLSCLRNAYPWGTQAIQYSAAVGAIQKQLLTDAENLIKHVHIAHMIGVFNDEEH